MKIIRAWLGDNNFQDESWCMTAALATPHPPFQVEFCYKYATMATTTAQATPNKTRTSRADSATTAVAAQLWKLVA